MPMQRGLPLAFNRLANRPSALLLEVVNSDRPCESMQLHHLIPNEIWNTVQEENKDIPFESFVGGRNNPKNIMELPSTQAGAMAMGLALHNGSHPAYSAYVGGKMERFVSAYKTESTTSPEVAAANFSKSVVDLEDKLRRGLTRSYAPEEPQLLLTSKDPYAVNVGPGQLHVTQVAEAIAAPLQSAVDMARADPRNAYPTAALADKNCEAAKELTVEQLQQVTGGLQEKGINIDAFANPEIPATAAAPAPLSFSDQVRTAFAQAAAEHPGHAAMAKVGVGLMVGAGAVAGSGITAAGIQAMRFARPIATLSAAR